MTDWPKLDGKRVVLKDGDGDTWRGKISYFYDTWVLMVPSGKRFLDVEHEEGISDIEVLPDEPIKPPTKEEWKDVTKEVGIARMINPIDVRPVYHGPERIGEATDFGITLYPDNYRIHFSGLGSYRIEYKEDK